MINIYRLVCLSSQWKVVLIIVWFKLYPWGLLVSKSLDLSIFLLTTWVGRVDSNWHGLPSVEESDKTVNYLIELAFQRGTGKLSNWSTIRYKYIRHLTCLPYLQSLLNCESQLHNQCIQASMPLLTVIKRFSLLCGSEGYPWWHLVSWVYDQSIL